MTALELTADLVKTQQLPILYISYYCFLRWSSSALFPFPVLPPITVYFPISHFFDGKVHYWVTVVFHP